MYVGLDVHKHFCYGTATDDAGNIVKSDKFSIDPQGLNEFIEGLDKAQVAMEAGYCWQPLTKGSSKLATTSDSRTRTPGLTSA